MSELTITFVRLGLLVLLWLFVFSVVGVLRGDLFGTRVTARAAQPPAPSPAPKTEKARRVPALPGAGRRAPSHLLVTEGPLRGTTITLGQHSVLIGRSPDSTLVLDDDYASGRHARIFPQDGEWRVEDLGSTNGTFADGQQVSGPQPLAVGSKLKIGTTVLELRR
jgi:pSer/pThr/pTyr-binding forkhead associated (FHA) protein